MIEVGRLCIKTAGRDARKKCVIIEIIDNNFVLIDGQTRRKRCNIKHLEPLEKVIKIKKKASHADVVKEFKKLKIEIKETKAKPKKERPKKVRNVKEKKIKKEGKKKIKKEKKIEEKEQKPEEKEEEIKKKEKIKDKVKKEIKEKVNKKEKIEKKEK